MLVVVAELDGNENEALDLVPLVTNVVLEVGTVPCKNRYIYTYTRMERSIHQLLHTRMSLRVTVQIVQKSTFELPF